MNHGLSMTDRARHQELMTRLYEDTIRRRQHILDSLTVVPTPSPPLASPSTAPAPTGREVRNAARRARDFEIASSTTTARPASHYVAPAPREGYSVDPFQSRHAAMSYLERGVAAHEAQPADPAAEPASINPLQRTGFSARRRLREEASASRVSIHSIGVISRILSSRSSYVPALVDGALTHAFLKESDSQEDCH